MYFYHDPNEFLFYRRQVFEKFTLAFRVDRGTAVRPNVNGNRRNIITATQINRPKPSSSSFIPKNSKQTSISITTVAQKQVPISK
jgi:hypothetical protein